MLLETYIKIKFNLIVKQSSKMSNITSFVIVLSHVVFFFKTVTLTEKKCCHPASSPAHLFTIREKRKRGTYFLKIALGTKLAAIKKIRN